MVKAHMLTDISWSTYGNEYCEKYQCKGGREKRVISARCLKHQDAMSRTELLMRHSGDAVWRSLDWAKCRGQRRIIKRLEHTPSGITEGRMGNINRELYLLGKARRWKHWLRLFCRLGGTLWFMFWGKRSIYYAKVVLSRQMKWDRTRGRVVGFSDSLGKDHVETGLTCGFRRLHIPVWKKGDDFWQWCDSPCPKVGKWHVEQDQGTGEKSCNKRK